MHQLTEVFFILSYYIRTKYISGSVCVVNHCWQLNCSACRSSKHEDLRRADQWPIYTCRPLLSVHWPEL